ncbi:MAG: hypothetical protein ACXVCP_16210 [Bdellovibrio sp.]
MTKESREIDIVLSRGRKVIAIEIKLKDVIDENEVEKLSTLAEGPCCDFSDAFIKLNAPDMH